MLNILSEWRARAGQTLGAPLPWSNASPRRRRWSWWGLTGQVTVVNSVLVALGLGLLGASVNPFAGLLIGVLGLTGGLCGHRYLVRSIYNGRQTKFTRSETPEVN